MNHQKMVWQGENKPRRRLNGEKLKYSVERLVRDSMGIRHSPKRKAWASVHLGRDRYKASTYNPMLTFRIHVERCFNGMIELGYLQVEKKESLTLLASDYLHVILQQIS